MAVIGNIRKHSGLLIVLIGGALLLFVLGDFLGSSTVFFQGTQNEVGVIDGKEVGLLEYNREVDQMEQSLNRQIDEATRVQIRNEVWNNLVREKVLMPEYEALGLKVSDEEIMDIIKNDPTNPNLRQYFTDQQTGQIIQQFRQPNGLLDGNAVIAYLKQYVFTDNPQAQAQEAKAGWLNFQENYLRKPTLDQKYSDLIGKGITSTDVDVRNNEFGNSSSISFNYVVQPFNSIADSTIEVTDRELKAYYDEHKYEAAYQQNDEVRSLDYIVFDVIPTEEDKKALWDELEDLKMSFETSTDDTLFVNENADTPFNIKWTSAGSNAPAIDTIFDQLYVGQIIGPFENNAAYELVKILELKQASDSVRASHILVNILDDDTNTATARIDSLKSEIEGGADFGMLARQFSADQGSAQNGGDLDWFTEGRMVKPFNDACFDPEAKSGDLRVVISQFGVHLIKIEEKTAPVSKALIAIIDNTIEPSNATYEAEYSKASSFSINHKDMDAFRDGGAQFGILKAPSIRKNDPTIMGMENSRTIVQWAFNAEVGQVSDVFDGLDDQYVVAMLTEVRPKGTLPYDIVKDQIRVSYLDKRKGEILAEKMSGKTDLQSLANEFGTQIQPIENVNFASFSIPGLGDELKLLGLAYSLEQGQVSKPIVGKRGVYVIEITNKTTPEVTSDQTKRKNLQRNYVSRAGFEAYEALREKANVEDNRSKYY
ncbi:MAG TPA: hypothetical protein DDX92_04460 [Flavobacteriales bacterium]|jgi:peptidyl-prolyl cis-trans isomerase D|nr:hypothetical protein [Flavobacteriales bacterium]